MAKLVRDRIPEIIRADGREPNVSILSNEEYRAALLEKLLEEAQELTEAKQEDRLEEAADVLEVLLAIGRINGFAISDVIEVADRKRAERGGFESRLFLESGDQPKN